MHSQGKLFEKETELTRFSHCDLAAAILTLEMTPEVNYAVYRAVFYNNNVASLPGPFCDFG